MKLPPVALTAPTLCPRCDAPALYEDHCSNCGLQLGVCGACRGVVGPFDRYCGFCGHDLAAGELRSPVWRFWLLVAMIPMVAALVVGVAFFGGPVATRVGRLVFQPQPASTPTPTASTTLYRSPSLHLVYAIPADWPPPGDYTKSPTTPLQMVVASRALADDASFGATKGDILAAKPTGALVTLGPLASAPPGADPTDPSSVLGADVAALTLSPPSGLKIEVVQPAATVTVQGQNGKEAVFRVTRSDGTIYYLERAYISTATGLFKIEALVPGTDWDSGDDKVVAAIIQSVRVGT